MTIEQMLAHPATISLLASLIGGSVVAVVAARLALLRFRAERLWDRKCQAYADILSGLYYLRSSARHTASHYESGQDGELVRADAKATDSIGDLRRLAALGTFLFDTEAAARLDQLIVDLDDPHYGQDALEEATADLAVSERALADIRVLARRDLGL